MVTDQNGNVVKRHDFTPFGEEVYAGTAGRTATWSVGLPDYLSQKFTGKERDSESGLDNFGARYYGSMMGRMMSPDPLMASAKAWDPQSWNRYA
jgi:RHS repeat-associated protein